MSSTPPSYSETSLIEAFPEFAINLPELGFGSFKAAYRIARPEGDAVLKVVKEPAVPSDDGDVAFPPRFEREIAAMKMVVSERVVQVLDGPAVRDIAGRPHVWYLEPFYAGGTLERNIGTPMTATDSLVLADALLEGVEALWDQARLVHRDIKPGNIALSANGPVLLDLGIALHVDLAPLTNAFGFSPRTPTYAAPEQFDIRHAAPIDSRTDQFLVGIVLFEAATGVHPFLGPDPQTTSEYFARLRSGVPNPTATAMIGNPCLLELVGRLLKPTPHERFRTPSLARHAVQACMP